MAIGRRSLPPSPSPAPAPAPPWRRPPSIPRRCRSEPNCGRVYPPPTCRSAPQNPSRRSRAVDHSSRQRSAPRCCSARRNGPPAAPPPLAYLANRPKQPIHRGCTHGYQASLHLCIQLQVPMPLHGGNQHGNNLLEPLAANPICCLPDHDQRLPHRLIVNAAPRSPVSSCRHFAALPVQHPNRMLPVKSGYLGELVKNALLLIPCAPLIAHRYRRRHLALACHAQLPPSVARCFHTKRVTFS